MRDLSRGAALVAAMLLIGATHQAQATHVSRHRHHHQNPAAAGLMAPKPTAPTVSPAAPPPARPADIPPTNPSNAAKAEPSAVMVDTQDAQPVLGKNVRSSAGEDMGHLVDVIVDRDGAPRAAIIDFGGFLGVGSRKIAVDWKALHFSPDDPKGNMITLGLTRDQVKAAPEYKEGRPFVLLEAMGSPQPVPSPHPKTQEN
jgi:PRC-barrel domain